MSTVLIIDLVLLVIFLIPLIVSWKRGFMRSVLGIAVIAASILVTYFYTPQLRDYYDKAFVHDKIAVKAGDALASLAGKSGDVLDLSELFKDKPQALTELAERFHMDLDALEKVYQDAVSRGVDDVAGNLAQTMTDKTSVLISTVLAALTLFLGTFIVAKLLSLLLIQLVKLPVLKSLDSVLGLLVGLVSGLLICYGAARLFLLALPALSATYPEVFGGVEASSSLILRFLV